MTQLPFSRQSAITGSFDEAYQAWKANPSPEANAHVLNAMNPMIDRAIGANVGPSNPVLRSHARRLALDSLNTYDPARSRIQTHLTSQFQQLKRYSRRQTEPVAVPERDYYNTLHLRQSEQELTDELGRDPTLGELSDRMHMTSSKIRQLRLGHSPRPEGSLPVDAETGEAASPAVRGLPDHQLTADLLMEDLPPADQKILEWTLGLNGQPRLSNQDIAAKLNRSPGLISQRKRLLQQQLDTIHSANLFGGGQ